MKFLFIICLFVFMKANALNVAIDIGHTPLRPGATSVTNVSEYYYNRQFSIILYNELIKHNISAFFVNPKEKEISLIDRVDSAKQHNADVLISIHHDSVKERFLNDKILNGKHIKFCNNFSGYSIFVSKKNIYFNQSFKIASSIASRLQKNGFLRSRHHEMNIKGENKELLDPNGVYEYDDLIVVKKARMPALLIEGSVIVNENEEKMMHNNNYAYWRKFAIVIVESLIDERKKIF